MPTPRYRIYDRTQPVTCHCISRCVRRTPLLSSEALRHALLARLRQLAEVFAVDVLEWALLSNHFHLVAATHPDLASLWSDEEVARRWRTLSPDYAWRRRNRVDLSLPAQPDEIAEALRQPELVARWRVDLADLSVFHKFLKQWLARMINLGDRDGGRCFDGRFKSIVAVDEEAVIAHMVYVALNPVRAAMARSLEDYEFCSVAERAQELKRRIRAGEFAGEAEEARRKLASLGLRPSIPCNPGARARATEKLPNGHCNPWFAGGSPSPICGSSGLGLVAYLSHVDAVGRTRRPNKPGAIAEEAPSPVEGLEPLLGGAERALWSGGISDAVSSMIESVESAMSGPLGRPVGCFSGGTEALARLAQSTGRQFVTAVASILGGGRRRVAAAKERNVPLSRKQELATAPA